MQLQHLSLSRMSLFLHFYPFSKTAEFLHPQTLCHNICQLIFCCYMFSNYVPCLLTIVNVPKPCVNVLCPVIDLTAVTPDTKIQLKSNIG